MYGHPASFVASPGFEPGPLGFHPSALPLCEEASGCRVPEAPSDTAAAPHAGPWGALAMSVVVASSGAPLRMTTTAPHVGAFVGAPPETRWGLVHLPDETGVTGGTFTRLGQGHNLALRLLRPQSQSEWQDLNLRASCDPGPEPGG